MGKHSLRLRIKYDVSILISVSAPAAVAAKNGVCHVEVAAVWTVGDLGCAVAWLQSVSFRTSVPRRLSLLVLTKQCLPELYEMCFSVPFNSRSVENTASP